MSRPPKFEPRSHGDSFILEIPPSFSDTGKRQRKFFKTKEDADLAAQQLKSRIEAGKRVMHRAGPELIRIAVHFHEIFRDDYGFEGGLKEACEKFIRQLDTEHNCISFAELLDEYEEAKSDNWGTQYKTSWGTFRSLLSECEKMPIISQGTDFWKAWLEEKAESRTWNPRTINDYTSMLSSVWKFGQTLGRCEKNPIDGIIRKKIRRVEKAVYSVEQVKAVLFTAWKHDRDLVPFFAIAIFAGVRPYENGEIGQLTWEDINFEDKWIRINFDNKTETKRFIPIEDNLMAWLSHWKTARGRILPPNFVKRRRYLTRGKYQSPLGTPEEEWTELVPYGLHVRDITRHTYGSYLEGKYRDRNIVKENMGHTDFETYEQHYRNARSPREAEEFWKILPPEED